VVSHASFLPLPVPCSRLVALLEDEMWKHFRSFTPLPEGRRILVDIENWSPFIIDLSKLQNTRPLDEFNKESKSFRLGMDKLQLRTKGGGEFNLYGESDAHGR